jgi:hypothetical protein
LGWVRGLARHWKSQKRLVTVRGGPRSLNLKSNKQWWAYAKSGKNPIDIPTAPNRVYADAGWGGLW